LLCLWLLLLARLPLGLLLRALLILLSVDLCGRLLLRLRLLLRARLTLLPIGLRLLWFFGRLGLRLLLLLVLRFILFFLA